MAEMIANGLVQGKILTGNQRFSIDFSMDKLGFSSMCFSIETNPLRFFRTMFMPCPMRVQPTSALDLQLDPCRAKSAKLLCNKNNQNLWIDLDRYGRYIRRYLYP